MLSYRDRSFRIPNRWLILFVLFFGRLTMAFQFQSVAALSPLIIENYAATLVDIGVIIGLFLAPGVIIAIPGGTIAARFGDQNVVFVGMALMLIGAAIFSFSPNWNWIIAGRLVSGAGGVIVNVVLMPMALFLPNLAVVAIFIVVGVLFGFGAGPIMSLPSKVLPPAARAFGMGVFFSVYYALMMVAPALAGEMSDRSGSAGVTLIFGALMLVLALISLGAFRRLSADLRTVEGDDFSVS